jgi:hypothetical protein
MSNHHQISKKLKPIPLKAIPTPCPLRNDGSENKPITHNQAAACRMLATAESSDGA